MGGRMRRGRFGPVLVAATLLAALLLPESALALTDEEIFRDFRFNFVNPGARSLGMGGAFIATGNDATAAQANPAALHYVYRNEFFIEYRNVQPDTELLEPSSQVGDPNSTTNSLFIRSTVVNNREDVTLPSFVSFAYPMRIAGRKARFAVSRQSVLDLTSSLTDEDQGLSTTLRFGNQDYPIWVNPDNESIHSCSDGVTSGNGGNPFPEQYTVCNQVEGGLDAELLHYNLSFSYSVTNDFSVGVTATYATLDMTSEVVNTAQDPLGFLVFQHPRVITPQGFAPVTSQTEIDDNDSGFAYTVGLHWHPDSAFPNRGGISPIRFGLVYRKGADLAVEETQTELGSGGTSTVDVFETTLRVPDRYGLGVSYDAWDHWTFALDVERIEYSDLLKDYRAGVNLFSNPGVSTSIFTIDPEKFEFEVDDATVVHAGVEFSLQSKGGWTSALRAGYFNSPDNRIRLTEVNSGDPQVDRIFKDIFRGGEDVNHYTTGFSVTLPIGLQIQAAADFSDDGQEYLISSIYRFGPVR